MCTAPCSSFVLPLALVAINSENDGDNHTYQKRFFLSKNL